MRWTLWLVAVLLAGCRAGDPAALFERPVTIYAAASLREVAGALAVGFTAATGIRTELNFAGSNVLAQQILAAPAADLFLSADQLWVRELERRGRVAPDAVAPFFGNRLALVAHRDSALAAGDPWLLAGDGYRHLALADPAAVPAGRYARARLEGMSLAGASLWQRVADRVVPAIDVRGALALAESDPGILAIVYATDARSSRRIKVLYEFPRDPRRPIRYWSARLDDGPNPEGGRRFQDFLASQEAAAVARRFGFTESA